MGHLVEEWTDEEGEAVGVAVRSVVGKQHVTVGFLDSVQDAAASVSRFKKVASTHGLKAAQRGLTQTQQILEQRVNDVQSRYKGLTYDFRIKKWVLYAPAVGKSKPAVLSAHRSSRDAIVAHREYYAQQRSTC